MASADLLLHPVRLRIVKAFLGDRALTTSQLAAELDDVPAGSLYRHVALLTKAGILQVVAERRVRGTVERTYTLRLAAAQIQPGEARAMTFDEHAQAFMAYIAGLMGDFDRYLASSPADPIADGANYRVAAMWLSDGEFAEFLRDLVIAVTPRLANAPAPGRRRRMMYNVFLPAPQGTEDNEDNKEVVMSDVLGGPDGPGPEDELGGPDAVGREDELGGDRPGHEDELGGPDAGGREDELGGDRPGHEDELGGPDAGQ
jgi:DNA-binding transcriptional ArsR family regulator